jgi:DNA-binding transcriptional MerR regulator
MSKPGGVVRDASRESAASLPSIPAKRYFTIGEVSDLCAVKPHVLRYWEQEFTQLKPIKRSGNRRYYQHHEVLLIRRIRELLYEQGFTINGARNRLEGAGSSRRRSLPDGAGEVIEDLEAADPARLERFDGQPNGAGSATMAAQDLWQTMRAELESIRVLLTPTRVTPSPVNPADGAGTGAP